DIICVARRQQSSNTRIWHYRAQKFNFFLRGFKYLILAKKPEIKEQKETRRKKIKWRKYK
ncbi:MAG: DNA methylase, partial [candidate division WOR-3 bacterium]|nr:DNA methylase [candidate division WOR-3 bacterium]